MSIDEKPADPTQRIDDDIKLGAEGASDIDPDSLEGRLRMLLPGHAYFKTESGLPGPLAQIAEQLDAQIVGVPELPPRLYVGWSTPTGIWLVKVRGCSAHDGETYHLEIDGPDTELERNHVTADQVIQLLTVVGAISG